MKRINDVPVKIIAYGRHVSEWEITIGEQRIEHCARKASLILQEGNPPLLQLEIEAYNLDFSHEALENLIVEPVSYRELWVGRVRGWCRHQARMIEDRWSKLRQRAIRKPKMVIEKSVLKNDDGTDYKFRQDGGIDLCEEYESSIDDQVEQAMDELEHDLDEKEIRAGLENGESQDEV